MKQSLILIFILIVLSIYTAVSYYVYSRGARALEGTNLLKLFKWSYWILVASFFIGQILERGNPGLLARIVSLIGSVWLAFFFYLLLFVVVFDLFRLVLNLFDFSPNSFFTTALSSRMLFIYASILAFSITSFGFINAKNPIVNNIELELDKKDSNRDSLKIVLATDVHLGVILGKNHARKLIKQINEQKPDIVLFGGDLVDHNPVPVVKNDIGACFEKIDAPLGVFAITGNHEFIGKPDISIDYFTQHGVTYIRDSVHSIEGIVQIVGRDDREKKQFTGMGRKSIEEIFLNTEANLPLLLLDHQPVEYDKVEAHNVDLMMSGHTHKGQLWPFSFITNAIFENHFGLIQKGKSWFYTSSGYGTWGPPIRTGNRPELVVFSIELK